jgi:hypothetical protein
MAKKTNWVLIVLGIIIFVVIVGVGACVGFGYYMVRQMDISTVNTANPEEDFAKARAQFAGQTPYIEVTSTDARDETIVHRELEKAEKTTLTGLHMMIYGPRDKRLLRVTIPAWLLRLGGSKPVSFTGGGSGGGFDAGVRTNITNEDLERFGKGLVLDVTNRRGERVLIWTE